MAWGSFEIISVIEAAPAYHTNAPGGSIAVLGSEILISSGFYSADAGLTWSRCDLGGYVNGSVSVYEGAMWVSNGSTGVTVSGGIVSGSPVSLPGTPIDGEYYWKAVGGQYPSQALYKRESGSGGEGIMQVDLTNAGIFIAGAIGIFPGTYPKIVRQSGNDLWIFDTEYNTHYPIFGLPIEVTDGYRWGIGAVRGFTAHSGTSMTIFTDVGGYTVNLHDLSVERKFPAHRSLTGTSANNGYFIMPVTNNNVTTYFLVKHESSATPHWVYPAVIPELPIKEDTYIYLDGPDHHWDYICRPTYDGTPPPYMSSCGWLDVVHANVWQNYWFPAYRLDPGFENYPTNITPVFNGNRLLNVIGPDPLRELCLQRGARTAEGRYAQSYLRHLDAETCCQETKYYLWIFDDWQNACDPNLLLRAVRRCADTLVYPLDTWLSDDYGYSYVCVTTSQIPPAPPHAPPPCYYTWEAQCDGTKWRIYTWGGSTWGSVTDWHNDWGPWICVTTSSTPPGPPPVPCP